MTGRAGAVPSTIHPPDGSARHQPCVGPVSSDVWNRDVRVTSNVDGTRVGRSVGGHSLESIGVTRPGCAACGDFSQLSSLHRARCLGFLMGRLCSDGQKSNVHSQNEGAITEQTFSYRTRGLLCQLEGHSFRVLSGFLLPPTCGSPWPTVPTLVLGTARIRGLRGTGLALSLSSLRVLVCSVEVMWTEWSFSPLVYEIRMKEP